MCESGRSAGADRFAPPQTSKTSRYFVRRVPLACEKIWGQPTAAQARVDSRELRDGRLWQSPIFSSAAQALLRRRGFVVDGWFCWVPPQAAGPGGHPEPRKAAETGLAPKTHRGCMPLPRASIRPGCCTDVREVRLRERESIAVRLFFFRCFRGWCGASRGPRRAMLGAVCGPIVRGLPSGSLAERACWRSHPCRRRGTSHGHPSWRGR